MKTLCPMGCRGDRREVPGARDSDVGSAAGLLVVPGPEGRQRRPGAETNPGCVQGVWPLPGPSGPPAAPGLAPSLGAQPELSLCGDTARPARLAT